MSIRVDDVKVKQNLRRLRGIDREVGVLLRREAIFVLADSKPLAPVDFGVLVNSGFATEPEKDVLGNIEVRVGYGGAAKEYAIPVHEIPDPPVHHPNGEFKYLEKPFVAKQDEIQTNIRNGVRAIMRSRVKR